MARTLVMKFGGTSVGNATGIRHVIEIVLSVRRQWDNLAIVVSAMSGVTDALLAGVNGSIIEETFMDHVAEALRIKHFNTLDELVPSAEDVKTQINTYLDEYLVLSRAIHVLGTRFGRNLLFW
jgi:aspartokinase/homoserine dehydrogenase 1